jgi:hypothetical protein
MIRLRVIFLLIFFFSRFPPSFKQFFTCGNANWYILLTVMIFAVEGGRRPARIDKFGGIEENNGPLANPLI